MFLVSKREFSLLIWTSKYVITWNVIHVKLLMICSLNYGISLTPRNRFWLSACISDSKTLLFELKKKAHWKKVPIRYQEPLDEWAKIILLRDNAKKCRECVIAVATWIEFNKILITGFLAHNLGRVRSWT